MRKATVAEPLKKGQGKLCHNCAHQFLHPEGHDEPCNIASEADLSPSPDGLTYLESCTHFILRTTTKEGGTGMTQEAETTVEQQPNQVTLEGLAAVDLKSKFSVDDRKWKHTLTLTMAVSEEDITAVRILADCKGTWYVALSVEGVQAALDFAAATAPGSDEVADPTLASRIEEAVGQKAG